MTKIALDTNILVYNHLWDDLRKQAISATLMKYGA
jgi:predicted nucleic acid-binding protein